MYVYLNSLHVSGKHVPIIGRINYINAIPAICHSMWTTVWYAELHTRRSHRVTYTRYRIDTVNSPDDGHIVARNM